MLMPPAHLAAGQPQPAQHAQEEPLDTLYAIFTPEEESNPMALSNMLPGLKEAYVFAMMSDSLMMDDSVRKQQLADMMRRANDITITLYSQEQTFAFDMAFTLERVAKEYDSFKEEAKISDMYLSGSRSGLRRYSMLGETLRDMYISHRLDSLMVADTLLQHLPQLDSLMLGDSLVLTFQPIEPLHEEDPEEKALLDSCLFYTDALTALYGRSVAFALQDSIAYAETDKRLQQAYDYAKANYAETQKRIFTGGMISIVQILKNWHSYTYLAKSDMEARFGGDSDTQEAEGSRALNGQNIPYYALLALLALIASFIVAALINWGIFKLVKSERARSKKPVLTAILALLLFVLVILLTNTDPGNPYWKMAYKMLSQFTWLTLAIFLSLLIRVSGSQARPARNLYFPTLLLSFLIILLRAIFLPASLVPFILPPALLVFIIWQSALNLRYKKMVPRADIRYMWVSVGVMAVACILALVGFSMIGVLLLTFWAYELALLHTITAIYHLMKLYHDGRVTRKKARYHEDNPLLPLEDKNCFIEVTWFYDLLSTVIIPILAILSLPVAAMLTTKDYQLSLTGADFLHTALFKSEKLVAVTPLNILIVVSLFFIFRYIIYVVKGAARLFKMRNIIEKKHAAGEPLKESEVNMSLANTIVSVLGWVAYLLIIFNILHIPTDALTTITTGLAAGVGFALKDLINNFFYGVQLMAGRIRVGDKISCDGIRGIVKRVSYQTTLVEDEDGSMIAFTNTDLFTKQFRNLNTGKNYEFIKMPVGIKYGTDVAKAREVILQALKPLLVKDKAGRDIVDPSFPIDVRFDSYGDNSVNLVVALYTTVEAHYTFPSRAKEAIYNAFAENGIEIPFPQRDVYIKSVPEKE